MRGSSKNNRNQKSPARQGKRQARSRRGANGSAGRNAWFPDLGRGRKRFGVGVAVAIAEARGGRPQVRVIRRESFSALPAGRNRQRLLEAVSDTDLARVLGGIGQRHRVRIGRAIQAGANSHQSIARAVGLGAGPLYHHLRSLERAGLVRFVERNRYDLTRLGWDLFLLVSVICAAAKRNP